MDELFSNFWSIPPETLLDRLGTTRDGLSSREAGERLLRFGPNRISPKRRTDDLTLFLAQFKSPIILILISAAILSFFLHDPVDTLIILTIVLISGCLGFWQEKTAVHAVERLLAMVRIQSTVLRDGRPMDVPVEELVSGDVIILNAGDVIAGDGLVLDSKDLYVDEATLTGETYPVAKEATILPPDTPLSRRVNALFMGTHVVSGTARALVIQTGRATEFGKIAESLRLRAPETEFEHGVRRFGYFLMEVTLLLVIAIFAVNVYLHRPVMESFLFALALAVGLTPQLLPAIISINLAHGARRMADQKVIVKRLSSIENFGSMNILCSDKTGTLTEGVVRLRSCIDTGGRESDRVFLYAYLNARYQSGFKNPIDEAIVAAGSPDISGYEKLDEVPYDFVRKRLSILVSSAGNTILITKGAFGSVLDVCSNAMEPDGTLTAISNVYSDITRRYEETSRAGFRLLGIAYKDMASERAIEKEHEKDMVFLGFAVFHDPPKAGINETIGELRKLGISLKVLSGDNPLVAATVADEVGLSKSRVITGGELRQVSDEALRRQVNDFDVFAEVEPNQKERIITALRKSGNVVGYMGDGINDASALHAADVGISVDSAVDVAKEAADIVLLEKDLKVLVRGVGEGRKTFANTLKYVFMATSANFGNMFSMAGASLVLSFLPLLPKQILLTNLLTDFPEMTIATDSTDEEWIERPRRWDIQFIKKFMLIFGLLSSIFDYLTFALLLFVLQASVDEFRTGWFIESVLSASMIVLVIRSRRPFFRSRPGRYLVLATAFVIVATLLFPMSPLGGPFGFVSLDGRFIAGIGLILFLYVFSAEVAKRFFYGQVRF
jgi:Mg2+-importing ATPase